MFKKLTKKLSMRIKHHHQGPQQTKDPARKFTAHRSASTSTEANLSVDSDDLVHRIDNQEDSESEEDDHYPKKRVFLGASDDDEVEEFFSTRHGRSFRSPSNSHSSLSKAAFKRKSLRVKNRIHALSGGELQHIHSPQRPSSPAPSHAKGYLKKRPNSAPQAEKLNRIVRDREASELSLNSTSFSIGGGTTISSPLPNVSSPIGNNSSLSHSFMNHSFNGTHSTCSSSTAMTNSYLSTSNNKVYILLILANVSVESPLSLDYEKECILEALADGCCGSITKLDPSMSTPNRRQRKSRTKTQQQINEDEKKEPMKEESYLIEADERIMEEHHMSTKLFQVDVLHHASAQDVRYKLLHTKGRYKIVHFSGHGNFDQLLALYSINEIRSQYGVQEFSSETIFELRMKISKFLQGLPSDLNEFTERVIELIINDKLVTVNITKETLKNLLETGGGLAFAHQNDVETLNKQAATETTDAPSYLACFPDAFASIIAKYSDNGNAGGKIECLVLNACASYYQGLLVSQLGIKYVISSKARIADKKYAPVFAKGFYEAVAANHDIPSSYTEGCNTVMLAHDVKTREILCEDGGFLRLICLDSKNRPFDFNHAAMTNRPTTA